MAAMSLLSWGGGGLCGQRGYINLALQRPQRGPHIQIENGLLNPANSGFPHDAIMATSPMLAPSHQDPAWKQNHKSLRTLAITGAHELE